MRSRARDGKCVCERSIAYAKYRHCRYFININIDIRRFQCLFKKFLSLLLMQVKHTQISLRWEVCRIPFSDQAEAN